MAVCQKLRVRIPSSTDSEREHMKITVTDKAASEVKKILTEQDFKPEEKVYLRLRVIGGGCSGYQHKLDLDPDFNEAKDTAYEVNGVHVVIDNRSALYLDGVIVDFHDDINKRGFSVINPAAKATCGCGSSFTM
jgi:iron-sulfur cluster insertion protein